MQHLLSFTCDAHALRIIDRDNNPWFVLKDLLAAMGSHTRIPDATASIKQGLGDEVVNDYLIPDALGRRQQTIIVSEAGATFLVARSNTEQGRRLNRFIHTEVLPAIRKTGGYRAGVSDRAASPTKTLDLARYAELLEAENALLRERARTANSPVSRLSDAQCAAVLNSLFGDEEVSHG